ncbi:TetR/AcrR family transcriptional regulator [Nocardioides sp. TF02-7]|uniref:TetR/AcrR family transcriptional regulator n=1 Tax=Nocardioides sp. TF02-7 TaxID=2917724 RepID=UPI001F05FDDC|nr:TetR/AcrR family transcriptional regulator [Nocardioides sp. TF02-7]UMG91961.1 TetR/AcrR family transcriptional regulator [Nocardioides sp. TF02-7]
MSSRPGPTTTATSATRWCARPRSSPSRGGPEAVTIRAAARAVGVTPTATYRHFENQADLLAAAKDEAMQRMAATTLALLPAPAAGPVDPVAAALERLQAAGRGYVQFALDQPGLFRMAFCPVPDTDDQPLQSRLAASPPYAFLASVLDELVEVGWLPAELRPGAEAGPWAAVHGLSLLLLDGPYRHLDAAGRDQVVTSTLDLVVRGLAGTERTRGDR